MKAGLARTRLTLRPGEAIRTPRLLLLFCQGDRWRGQNLLRQFILAQHRPRLAGQPLVGERGQLGGETERLSRRLQAVERHAPQIRPRIDALVRAGASLQEHALAPGQAKTRLASVPSIAQKAGR